MNRKTNQKRNEKVFWPKWKYNILKNGGVTAKSVRIGKFVSFNPYIMKEEMSEIKEWPPDQQHQHHPGTQTC